MFDDEGDEGVALNVDAWQDQDIEIILDSGCCRHVLAADEAPGYPVHDSPGSRRGQNFIVGNGAPVPNEGQVCLNLEADIGKGETKAVSSVFQVADLNRPLMSVSQVCDNGYRCVFEKDHALILSPAGEVAGRFVRRSGLYVATTKLKAPAPFGRQGA